MAQAGTEAQREKEQPGYSQAQKGLHGRQEGHQGEPSQKRVATLSPSLPADPRHGQIQEPVQDGNAGEDHQDGGRRENLDGPRNSVGVQVL